MTNNILNISDIDKACKIRRNTPSLFFFETFASNRPSICNYSGLSFSRLPSLSNIFLSQTETLVPGTSVWASGYYSLFISNTLYLEYLLISNIYFRPWQVSLSFSNIFFLGLFCSTNRTKTRNI